MRYLATASVIGGLVLFGYGCLELLGAPEVRFTRSKEGSESFGPIWLVLLGLVLSAWGSFELLMRARVSAHRQSGPSA